MNKSLYGYPSNEHLDFTYSLSKRSNQPMTYGFSYRYNLDQGIKLNGTSQYVSIPKLNTSVPRPKDFAFLKWFRFGAIPSGGIDTDLKNLFSTLSGSDYLNIYTGKSSGGSNIDAAIFHGNASGGSDSATSLISNVLLTLEPYCILFNYTSSTNTLNTSLNGVLRSTKTLLSTKLPATFQTSRIGNFSSFYFNGTSGDTRIFDFNITEKQFEKHYNDGLGSNNLDHLPHLLWLPWNGDANDISGNNFNGTLVNSPTYENFIK